MHAHAFKSVQQGGCSLWGHWRSSPRPIRISLDSAGDIQATIYRSCIHALGYKLSILPRLRMQSQRRAIMRHSASPLSCHPLLTVPLSNSARAGRHVRCLLYPSSTAFSGTMSPHLDMVPPPTSTPHPPKPSPGSSPSQGPTPGLLCPRPAEERWALDG